MCFLCNNLTLYKPNISYHKHDTRRKLDLHCELKNLSMVQKGVHYTSTKVFNALPSEIKTSVNEPSKFKQVLKQFLLEKSIYTLDEYFNQQ